MSVRTAGSPMLHAFSNPGRAWALVSALMLGQWYRLWYRLRGRRFKVGRNFRVFGRLVLRGPGRVTFGDDIVLMGRVTPWTHSPDAHISVGDNSRLDGVRFGCVASITVGRDCMLAECEIIDTDFHSSRADRRTNRDAPVRVSPVRIDDNVWIGGQVGILPGTWLGRNSVVGFRAVCVRRYPPDSIIFGNPAAVVGRVAPGTSARNRTEVTPSLNPVRQALPST